MSISKWLFAIWYDLLNAGVEGRVIPYRKETAGRTWGDVLEIGGGTGSNLPYYPDRPRLPGVPYLPPLRGAPVTHSDFVSSYFSGISSGVIRGPFGWNGLNGDEGVSL